MATWAIGLEVKLWANECEKCFLAITRIKPLCQKTEWIKNCLFQLKRNTVVEQVDNCGCLPVKRHNSKVSCSIFHFAHSVRLCNPSMEWMCKNERWWIQLGPNCLVSLRTQIISPKGGGGGGSLQIVWKKWIVNRLVQRVTMQSSTWLEGMISGWCFYLSERYRNRPSPLRRLLSWKRSISNFSGCSLTRNITPHSIENLTFHSLLRWLRWKMIATNSHYTSLTHLSLKAYLETVLFLKWM